MKIYRHPLCTHDLGAPSDMQDGSCDSLPVMYSHTPHGLFAVSFWQPEEADMAVLRAGGSIALHVRAPGRQHPVVALGVALPTEPQAHIYAKRQEVALVIREVLAECGPTDIPANASNAIVAALIERGLLT